MPTEILTATGDDGREVRYLLDVFQDGDTWTSTLRKLDERGQPTDAAVAPRFYGVSAEQARRRMIGVLENQYDEVRSAPAKA